MAPTTLLDLIDDIDGEGQTLNNFVSFTINELQLAGSVGALIEFDENTNRPIVKTYAKENIINVSNNFIVLTQTYEAPSDKDKYVIEMKTEYLELTYDENGNYIQNIWRAENKKLMIIDTITPTNRGESLKKIPFVICDELTNDPILLHLANVNLDQYLLSTDQRWGLHWTALPTLNAFGEFTDEDGNTKQLNIGAGSFNHFEDPAARVELLEFQGAGIGSVKTAIDDDIATMAGIGAKMLSSGKSGVEAAETARIGAAGETATLSTIANSVDEFLNNILDIMSDWAGVNIDQIFLINRDFIDVKMDAPLLLAYLQTLQGGGMSLHTFLSLLEKGETLPKGVTAEDEANRIETTGNDFLDLDE